MTARGLMVVPAEKRQAVLIGINQYPSPVSELECCVNDISALAEELGKIGFKKENIHIMTDKSKGENLPTGKNILKSGGSRRKYEEGRLSLRRLQRARRHD